MHLHLVLTALVRSTECVCCAILRCPAHSISE